jgi:hypothetical protein
MVMKRRAAANWQIFPFCETTAASAVLIVSTLKIVWLSSQMPLNHLNVLCMTFRKRHVVRSESLNSAETLFQ